jgi:4-hydroxybutyrate CoA-transferase
MDLITAEDAIDRIPTGSRIVASPHCGTPTTLVNALAARSAGRELCLMTGLVFVDEVITAAVRRGDLAYVTWQMNAALEPLLAEGLISYVPLRASRVPAHLAACRAEVALVRVTPPDRHGWCSLGPSVSYVRDALEHATLRIAEVDSSLPRTLGQSMVHVSDLDLLVESTDPLPVYAAATPSALSDAIAGHVMELLPERPVLQLGIGAVPEALVTALGGAGVSDLRFTGMVSDGMVELAERGLLDRRQIAGMPPVSGPDILGTSRVMQWAHDNPSVGMYPSTLVHSPLVLATYDRLVSINSAVEVDLSGQVNAERLKGRQISGIGGSIDFVESATHSAGGLRIIALPSTTPNGKISRIVPRLGESSIVTLSGAQVQIVVTEHGAARLEGASTRERAEALVGIAAPQHREELLAALR